MLQFTIDEMNSRYKRERFADALCDKLLSDDIARLRVGRAEGAKVEAICLETSRYYVRMSCEADCLNVESSYPPLALAVCRELQLRSWEEADDVHAEASYSLRRAARKAAKHGKSKELGGDEDDEVYCLRSRKTVGEA